MPEHLKIGLEMLAGSAVFGVFFAVNKRAGRAIFSHWAFSDSPATYWLFQAIWGFFAMALLICSILVLTGITPP